MAPMSPLLDRLREALADLPTVRLAAVFGSVARGEERPGSDMDVGVRLEPDSSALRQEVEAALGRAAGREVDVVYLDEAPPLLRFEIGADGIVLVERQPHAWSDFRMRAMIDWWDWAPTAKRIEDAAIRRLRASVADGQT
jgi:predicted nucleotidyltransferase